MPNLAVCKINSKGFHSRILAKNKIKAKITELLNKKIKLSKFNPVSLMWLFALSYPCFLAYLITLASFRRYNLDHSDQTMKNVILCADLFVGLVDAMVLFFLIAPFFKNIHKFIYKYINHGLISHINEEIFDYFDSVPLYEQEKLQIYQFIEELKLLTGVSYEHNQTSNPIKIIKILKQYETQIEHVEKEISSIFTIFKNKKITGLNIENETTNIIFEYLGHKL